MMTEILTADDGDRERSMRGVGGECRRGRGEDGSWIRVLASMSFSLELPVACTLLTSNTPVPYSEQLKSKARTTTSHRVRMPKVPPLPTLRLNGRSSKSSHQIQRGGEKSSSSSSSNTRDNRLHVTSFDPPPPVFQQTTSGRRSSAHHPLYSVRKVLTWKNFRWHLPRGRSELCWTGLHSVCVYVSTKYMRDTGERLACYPYSSALYRYLAAAMQPCDQAAASGVSPTFASPSQ